MTKIGRPGSLLIRGTSVAMSRMIVVPFQSAFSSVVEATYLGRAFRA
jgi:hypothetical protein